MQLHITSHCRIGLFFICRNTLRVTRSAALQQLDGTTGNNNSFLGKRNKDFEFSDLKPMKVQFVECSALDTSDKDQPGLMEVEKWLMTVAWNLAQM